MEVSAFSARFDYDPDNDLLGEGGFGKIFRAWDNVRNEYIALKMSKVQSGMDSFSLLNEYERVKSLEHPNIARYMHCWRLKLPGIGTHDVAIMKHYEHGNLSQLLAKHTLTELQKQKIIDGILDGIGYLHQQRPLIIHSDLKPSNILIVERRGFYIPLITDFGISRQANQTDKSYVTNTVGAGTYAYAAPEQWEARELRPNADLWSFGILAIYVWFNGKKLPFRSDDLSMASESGRIEYMRRVMSLEFIPDLDQLPMRYRGMVAACLVTDPNQRIKSVSQLFQSNPGDEGGSAEESTRILPGPASAPVHAIQEATQIYPSAPVKVEVPADLPPPQSPVESEVREKGSKKWRVPVAGLVLLVVATGGGWLATRNRAPTPQATVTLSPVPDRLPVSDTTLKDTLNVVVSPASTQTEGFEKKIEKASNPAPVRSEKPAPDDNRVYHVADIQPSFPGGSGAMKRWISDNLHMPQAALAVPYFSGTVRLTFTINKQGRPEEIQVVKGPGYGCEEEAVRLVKAMPAWSPAYNKGQPVRFKQTTSILFE